jgi:hypothetical protein
MAVSKAVCWVDRSVAPWAYSKGNSSAEARAAKWGDCSAVWLGPQKAVSTAASKADLKVCYLAEKTAVYSVCHSDEWTAVWMVEARAVLRASQRVVCWAAHWALIAADKTVSLMVGSTGDQQAANWVARMASTKAEKWVWNWVAMWVALWADCLAGELVWTMVGMRADLRAAETDSPRAVSWVESRVCKSVATRAYSKAALWAAARVEHLVVWTAAPMAEWMVLRLVAAKVESSVVLLVDWTGAIMAA